MCEREDGSGLLGWVAWLSSCSAGSGWLCWVGGKHSRGRSVGSGLDRNVNVVVFGVLPGKGTGGSKELVRL